MSHQLDQLEFLIGSQKVKSHKGVTSLKRLLFDGLKKNCMEGVEAVKVAFEREIWRLHANPIEYAH